MSRTQHVVGIGGYGTREETGRLHRYVLDLTRRKRPRILHVPTAHGDSSEAITRFYERFGGLGDLSHLKFFPWPPEDLRERVLRQHAISVGGGNTANMLAIWRVHGFD